MYVYLLIDPITVYSWTCIWRKQRHACIILHTTRAAEIWCGSQVGAGIGGWL